MVKVSLLTRASARTPFSSQLREIGDLHLPACCYTPLLSSPCQGDGSTREGTQELRFKINWMQHQALYREFRAQTLLSIPPELRPPKLLGSTLLHKEQGVFLAFRKLSNILGTPGSPREEKGNNSSFLRPLVPAFSATVWGNPRTQCAKSPHLTCEMPVSLFSFNHHKM